MPRFLAAAAFLILFLALAAPTLAQDLDLRHKVELEAFYAERAGEPLWVGMWGLNSDGKKVLHALKQSWQEGLNPKTYHVPEIESALQKGGDSFALELMLTDGLVSYVRDLSGMRVKANALGLQAKDWRQPKAARKILDDFKSQTNNIPQYLETLTPRTKTYQTLKAELIRLTENFSDSDDPPPLKFKGLAMPGKGYADIPKLRARFGLKDVPDHQRYTYDDELAAAVMAFQSERGLKPDGIIGERTLHALNITRQDKIRQLIVNLERLRWVPENKPKRFIVVNIPSAMLWAIDNGAVIHEMPVIVGRPKRETPSFVTYIHGVRFNPTWTVPPTIKKEDILPKLREDPAYFLDKGMELYDGQGKDARTIDPTTLDWHTMTESQAHALHMVQVPGANNPLGAIRVLMPNPQNIYLHDTNHHALFDKYDRALSSGCIRMKDPEKIADFILSFRKNWKPAQIQEWIANGKTKDVYVDENMPVYLMYYTAWADEAGRVVYGMDIYNKDAALFSALEKLDGLQPLKTQ